MRAVGCGASSQSGDAPSARLEKDGEDFTLEEYELERTQIPEYDAFFTQFEVRSAGWLATYVWGEVLFFFWGGGYRAAAKSNNNNNTR